MAYKVGFVGSGGISNRYARIFSEHDELELISCCDVVKDKANILADHYNMNPYTNYQEMINKEHLDIVYIGVPPVVHSEVVSYAINKKLKIIAEKPIAYTIDVGKKMTKEAKSSNVVTCINLMIVYSNHVQKIKKMYKNYEFGSLRRVELVLRFPIWPREWQNVSWLKTSEQGGPLREVGTHFFASLKESGLYENSIIIMYGDHYGISENHNVAMGEYLGREITPFESAQLQRVPLFIHIPESGVGEVNHTLAGQIDLKPTIENLVGIESGNAIQFGQDIFSEDNDNFVILRDGRFITEDIVYAGETCWDKETGEAIDSEICLPYSERANEELAHSDEIIYGDLLRFYDAENGRLKEEDTTESVDVE